MNRRGPLTFLLISPSQRDCPWPSRSAYQEVCAQSIHRSWPLRSCSRKCWGKDIHFRFISSRRPRARYRYRYSMRGAEARIPRRLLRRIRAYAQRNRRCYGSYCASFCLRVTRPSLRSYMTGSARSLCPSCQRQDLWDSYRSYDGSFSPFIHTGQHFPSRRQFITKFRRPMRQKFER